MVVVSLTEGTHTLKWTLAGYDTLEVQISVNSAGWISCTNNTNLLCNSSTPPNILIMNSTTLGATITAYLKQTSTGYTNMCTWISTIGGVSALKETDLYNFLDAMVGFGTLKFTPTYNQFLGFLDYMVGFKASGNTLTGCTL